MRITMINTHDLVGGAERCSYDLTTHLRRSGDDVTLIVGRKYGDDRFVKQVRYRYPDYRLRALAFEAFGLTDTTLMAPLYNCIRWDELRNADVYSIHNVHGAYWNIWTLPILARRAPVVMTLHDEWFLTGDCAYTYECDRWLAACGRCPQAAVTPFVNRYAIGGRDATRVNVLLKRAVTRFIPPERLTIVAPSLWLRDRARRAPHLARYRFRHIEYGIDLAVYRRHDSAECRRKFGLPPDAKLIFVAAANLADRRKNFELLLDIVRGGALPAKAMIVCAGRPPAEELRHYEGLPIRFLGFLSQREEMARALSACDISLLLSRADNLPYVGLEAQACGCPTIATSAGGIPEIVEDGATGWLIPAVSAAADLVGALRRACVLDDAQMAGMRHAARARAEARYGLETFAAKYREAFSEAIRQCA